MALLTYIKRGNLIEFTATFENAAGVVVSPDSAALYLSYINAAAARVTTTVAMADDSAGTFTCEWDSSVAKKGRVHWSVQAENPSAADDGQFELEANMANPDPA